MHLFQKLPIETNGSWILNTLPDSPLVFNGKENESSSTDTGSTSGQSDYLSLNGTLLISKQANSAVLKSDTLEALFIGNLDHEVTEEILIEIFSRYKSFISAKICFNTYTKKSLGHGYLNFGDKEDTELVMEEMSYTKILNNEVRIMPSMRDNEYRKRIGTNVFFSNLPIDNPLFTTRVFYETFKNYGKILSCKLEKSKNIGFLYFKDETDAINVIKTFNNKEIWGSRVFCTLHYDKTLRREGSAIKQKEDIQDNIKISDQMEKNYKSGASIIQNSLMIKNLPLEITEKEIENKLEISGSITIIKKTEVDSAWAIVRVPNPKDCSTLINKWDSKELETRILNVSLLPTTSNLVKNSRTRNVYLSNLCVLCDTQFLKQVCTQEKIKYKKVKLSVYDKHTVSYNGQIECCSTKDSDNLIKFLHNRLIGGSVIRASYEPLHTTKKLNVVKSIEKSISKYEADFNVTDLIFDNPSHCKDNTFSKHNKSYREQNEYALYNTTMQTNEKIIITSHLNQVIMANIDYFQFPNASIEKNIYMLTKYIIDNYWNGNFYKLSHFLNLMQWNPQLEYQLQVQISEAAWQLKFKR